MSIKENFNAYDMWLVVVTSNNYQPTKDTFLYISEGRKYMKFLDSKYHSAIIFLALEQGYVSYGDLKHLGYVNWTRYLSTLIENQIIKKTRVRNSVKDKYKYLSGYGSKQIDKITFYCLTEKAFQFFTRPATFEFLKDVCINKSSIQMMLDRKREDYENNLAYRTQKQEQERMKGILAMRKAGVELPQEDKKFYEKLLGRTVR